MEGDKTAMLIMHALLQWQSVSLKWLYRCLGCLHPPRPPPRPLPSHTINHYFLLSHMQMASRDRCSHSPASFRWTSLGRQTRLKLTLYCARSMYLPSVQSVQQTEQTKDHSLLAFRKPKKENTYQWWLNNDHLFRLTMRKSSIRNNDISVSIFPVSCLLHAITALEYFLILNSDNLKCFFPKTE